MSSNVMYLFDTCFGLTLRQKSSKLIFLSPCQASVKIMSVINVHENAWNIRHFSNASHSFYCLDRWQINGWNSLILLVTFIATIPVGDFSSFMYKFWNICFYNSFRGQNWKVNCLDLLQVIFCPKPMGQGSEIRSKDFLSIPSKARKEFRNFVWGSV